MQPSCSHLNLPVIIALIMFAACRLMVTVLSLDGFFRQKWGSHFTYISPEAFIFTVPWVLPKSENDTNFSDLGPAHVRGGILTCLRARRHASVYNWRQLHHGATVNWTEDVGKTMTAMLLRHFHVRKWTGNKTVLREEGNAGGSQVSGETSKRAISPPQMRLLCQVQGYYDAAEASPLKQGAKRRQDWRSQTMSFSLARHSDQTGKIFCFLFFFF